MAREIILSSLSYQGLMDEIKTFVQQEIPDWDFDNDNDIGKYILELVAAIIERHNVYSNSLANECFIDTAVDVRRLSILAHQLGYLPATPQPGTVLLKLDFLIPAGAPSINIIPNTIRIKASGVPFSVFYENKDTIVLPANTGTSSIPYSVSATFIEGITKQVSFVADGLDFSIYEIDDIGIILDINDPDYGIKVNVNGEDYHYVPTFNFSVPGQRVFRLMPHLEGKLRIQFSDNFLGEKPMQGDTINITYRVGGGIYNLLPNQVKIIDTVPSGVILNNVIQLERTIGGSFGDTLTTIKKRAYVLNDYGVRLETEEQIEYFGRSIPGVGRLKASALGTLILIVIIPTGLGLPDTQLEDTVKNAIIPRVPMGYDFSFTNPIYKEIGIVVKLRTNIPSSRYGELEVLVQDMVTKYLHPLTMDASGNFLQDFGSVLKISNLLQLLKDNLGDVFDYEIKWKKRGDPTFVTTDLNMALGEIATPYKEVPSLTINMGGDTFKIFATTQNSINKFLYFEILPPVSNSKLTSNLNITPTSITYSIELATNSSQNTVANLVNFINNDPYRFLSQGNYIGGSKPIYRSIPLFGAELISGSGNATVSPYSSQQLTGPSDMVNFDVIITN